jgi:hypothetical protein
MVVPIDVIAKMLALLAIPLGVTALLIRCVQSGVLRGHGLQRIRPNTRKLSTATRLVLAYVTGESSTDQHSVRGGSAWASGRIWPRRWQDGPDRTIEDSSSGETCCTLLASLLPEWPISDLLITALDELHALNAGIGYAQSISVSDQRLDGLREEVHVMALHLGRQVAAIAAIAAMNVHSEDLRRVLQQHEVGVQRLGVVIHEAREGLALLALTHADRGDAARIEQGFRVFTEVAKDELA